MDRQITTPITIMSTVLSALGCVVIFIIHNCWKELRSKSRTILLYITAADFFTATGYFIILASNGKSNDTGCIAQSFVTTTASMVSFFWTCCLALYLYALAVYSSEELGLKIIRVFHCISWPIPLGITLAAAVAGVLGRSSHRATVEWCWIMICDFNMSQPSENEITHTTSILWMLFTGKLWEIISYILITILYLRIWYHVKKQIKRIENNHSSTVMRFRLVEKRMILIPVLFILIRIWGTIRFVIYAINGSTTSFLFYLQAFGDGSQGFVNAVLFCLMTQRVKLYFRKLFYGRWHKEEAAKLLVQSGPKPPNCGQNHLIV